MSVMKRMAYFGFGAVGVYIGYESARIGWTYILGAMLNVDPAEAETTK